VAVFGFVSVNMKELDKAQQLRYNAVYCGICRQIRSRSSQSVRLVLSYDMAFLALLLMSLYEPEETVGDRACMLHPLRKRAWADNEYIRYAADMNIALAYYKAQDDVSDDNHPGARLLVQTLGKYLPALEQQYPRQCSAMKQCTQDIAQLEHSGCSNPDLPAGRFGTLMGELLVYREDLWAPTLRQMGDALGRFIYLTDAAVDYRRDRKRGKYNPFLALGMDEDWLAWEHYLVLTMGRCTEQFEKLPLVQDKALLDSILYSGVWTEFRRNGPRLKAAQEETQ